MKTALITGGAGFIGSHTADALKKAGYRVRILDNLEHIVHGGVWPTHIKNKGFILVRGDVRFKKDWLRALQGVDVVFHFAAYQDQRPDFSKFFEVNTMGTALLYEIIAENKLPVKKIVLASSQFVYGDGEYECVHKRKIFYPELRAEADLKKKRFEILCAHGKPARFRPFREEQKLTPTNSYGLSKEALEHLALRLGKTYNIPTTILRYSIVQGARQSPRNLYSGALRIFITQALKHKPITVYEDGKQLRDFVNVKDVVRANFLALKPKADFEILNVGGGKAWTVLEFAELVKKLTKSKSGIAIGGYRRTDTRNAVSDISKFKHLGWRPRYTPKDSVKEYTAWYKANF